VAFCVLVNVDLTDYKANMTAHALLSASGAKRWLSCTPSARLEATLPEPRRNNKGLDFSAEGTLAHSLSEIRLRHHFNQIGIEEYQREYEIIKEHPIYKNYTEEEREDFEAHVDNYVLYVRSQIGEGDTPLFEQRVDFSDWVNDGFGTADVVILSKHKIRVIDLKFGRGIPVSAIDNPQLRLYALGAYSKFKEEFPEIKEVEYVIHQPRLDSISSDGTSIHKLLDWANTYVKSKAKRAWAGSGEFIPGEWCQFCKAKAQCRARADFNNEVAKLEFRSPPLLTDEELTGVLAKAQDIRTWVNDVEEYALERAVTENVVPTGFKLATTVTHRKISDTEFAATILKEKGLPDDAIWEPRKLKSIATLEKLGPKGQVAAWLSELIVRPEGSPKLVRDKSSQAKEDFK
jgi:hypothetical protein